MNRSAKHHAITAVLSAVFVLTSAFAGARLAESNNNVVTAEETSVSETTALTETTAPPETSETSETADPEETTAAPTETSETEETEETTAPETETETTSETEETENSDIALLSLEEPETLIYNGITFTEWTNTDSLPTEAGNWYLSEDVTLSKKCTIKPGGTINLYLNGKNVTCTKGYIEIDTGRYYNPGSVYVPTILNLYDDGSGSIIGGVSEDQTIKVCGWNAGEVRCSLNVYGGKICGSKRAVDNRGILTVKGGTLEGSLYGIDNPAIGSECIIEGGAINGTKYYGIYNYIGDVKISGGEISGTKVGVLNQDGNVTVSGDAIIKGTGSDGVGIMNDYYLYGGDNLPQYLEVNGGIISGKEAGVKNNVSQGHITLNGGTVCGKNGVELYSGEEDADHFSNNNGIEVDSENYTVNPDGSITVQGDSEIKKGSSDVELPQGGKISPDGTISGKEIVLKNPDGTDDIDISSGSGDISVTSDGNITVPGDSTVKINDKEIGLPNGGTVNSERTVTANEMTLEDVTVTGDGVTVDKEGNITVPEGSTVQTGDTEVILPDGGTIDNDGTVKADTIQIGDNTISGEGLTLDTSDGIKISNTGKIFVTEKNVTVEYAGDTEFTDGINSYSVSDGYILLKIEDKDIDAELGKFIGNKVGSNYEIKVPYDITLLYNGVTEVQPSVKVNVTIVVPSDVNGSEAKVFHQNGSDFELVDATYSPTEKTLSFETEHFSIYAIAVPVPINTDPTDEPDDNNDDNNNGSSGGLPTAPKAETKSVNISVDDKITGKTSVVISQMNGSVITAALGKEYNGYFANVFTESGDLIYVSKIKNGTITFTYAKDEKLIIVIDSISYAEDVTAGAGEFSSESEIVENSGAKTAVCISAIFAAAIMTGIVLKRKKQ